MKNALSGFRRRAGVAACLVAIAAAIAFTPLARSQNAPPSSAEQAIKYRQSVYKVILWNFGPMAAVAQGKAPYDAEEFARHAERVAQMAPMLLEGYPEGSATGATTRAKPEIWSNVPEFRQLMTAMEGKAAALAAVAKGGDEEKAKAAFVELGGACKACHTKFRSD